MKCNGHPVTAVIDTGSQLNVVKEEFALHCIGLPIDLRKGLVMNDANGGEGYLKGLVENVPLTCGGVETQTNLYVGANVPFDLLLGCPWQRRNFVSIDERTNGTYLVFKDKDTLKPSSEILVTVERKSLYPHKQVGMLTIARPKKNNILQPEDLQEIQDYINSGKSCI